MDLENHIKHTLRVYGRRAEEVHRFLDQFWTKYKISHRRLLHHRLGVQLAVKQLGETAWGPAEVHILDDIGYLPVTWLDHDHDTVYLEPYDKENQERDLILLYGQKVYDEITGGNHSGNN